MNGKKTLRPTNRVNVSNDEISGQVLRVGRRRQGGAWVPEYLIRYDHDRTVRRVRGLYLRPTPKIA